ncbi:hypothetical protein AB0425_40955, partial [Actinosynnema sp. NPDC051121]
PFHRFRTPEGKGVDSLLGPEMKSTGEVMGIDVSFGMAYAKSQAAAGISLPGTGKVYVSFTEAQAAKVLPALDALRERGLDPVTWAEGSEVDVRGGLEDGVVLVVTLDRTALARDVRATASYLSIPVVTTVPGLRALAAALTAAASTDFTTTPLQRIHDHRPADPVVGDDGIRQLGYDPVVLDQHSQWVGVSGA